VASSLLGVIIFSSVFTKKKKPNQERTRKKKTRNQIKTTQIDQFWFGFGLFFYPKNWKNLHAFFWAFLAL